MEGDGSRDTGKLLMIYQWNGVAHLTRQRHIVKMLLLQNFRHFRMSLMSRGLGLATVSRVRFYPKHRDQRWSLLLRRVTRIA